MGYVYILTNEAMPNLVKIGYTDRTPEERAAELYKDQNSAVTGVRVPFDVFKKELTMACQRLCVCFGLAVVLFLFLAVQARAET